MTGSIHIIKLRQIWSQISSSIYPATPGALSLASEDCATVSARIHPLRQSLDEWNASTPSQPQNFSSGPLSVFTSRDWFRLAYHHSILLLYRHYLTCGHNEKRAASMEPRCRRQDVDTAFRECFSSAREICLMYRQTYQQSSVRYTWGSLHILFLGALTYLHCLWTSEQVRKAAAPLEVINTCTACNMVLVIIAERWAAAASYRDLFEKLSERTINMICGALQRPQLDLNSGRISEHVSPPQSHDADASFIAQFGDPDPMLSQPVFKDSEIDGWIMGLGDMNVPDESEWLVQDLIRGFGSQQDSHF